MRAANVLVFKVISTAFVVAVAGCGIDFERASEVLDRRVIAMSAEPPEVVLEDGATTVPTVRVRALVGDVKGLDAPTAYEWRTCIPNGAGAAGGYDAVAGRCDEKLETTLADAGTKPLDALGLDLTIPAVVVQGVRALAAQGQAIPMYVDVQVRIEAEPKPLYALKRVVVAPALPAGKKANRNPRLTALLLDGAPWEPGTAKRIKYGACEKKVASVDPSRRGVTSEVCEHRIDPVFDAGEAEPYTVQSFTETPDGKPVLLDLQERLRFAWFSNFGGFSRGTTEQQSSLDIKTADPLSTKWREPPEKPAGEVTLWVVTRDGRGGTSWDVRTIAFE